MEKICVAVRVRPPISEETLNGTHWKVQENHISLHNALGTPISGASFTFDHVFDQNCTNARVYELHTRDVIHAAVNGFNGTAFAYGQTSSGKTFTMNGSHNDPGIIPLAVQDIFRNIEMITDREFLIRVSYMEIYNEVINDLFSPESNKLQIHESLERGVFVAGLREEIVNSREQVLKLLDYGEVNRHVGQTNMNIRSSRSHTIFRMVIESRRKDTTLSGDILNTDAVRVSVLNLVDLAGSERIAKTGAGGVRLKEGKHINKSLMVLGTVINKLCDGGKQRGHIPYRDSKLTRILQPALGGNAKTSIICTIAPEEVHIDETRGTLQFASRAKRITNCAQVNEILTDAALLKRQKLEIEELRKKLQGSHSEVLEQEILKLRNDMLKYELEHEKLAMELEEERKSQKEREECIREQQMKIDNLSSLVILSDHGSSVEINCPECALPQQHSLGSLGQGFFSVSQRSEEEYISNHVTQRDSFATPLKGFSSAFVVDRSNHHSLLESSPIPDDFLNIADEDLWMRLNKGHAAPDFDLLLRTPDRKHSSLASNDIPKVSCPIEYYKEEVESLKRQLESALLEKDELKKKHTEQLSLNKQLMLEISGFKNESTVFKQVPQRMLESVANYSDAYKMILSNTKGFEPDQKSMNEKLQSCAADIGMHLFSTLESHLLRVMDGHGISTMENSAVQEQCRLLVEKMNCAVASLISSERSIKPKGPASEDAANAGGKMESNNQVLEVAEERYRILEGECNLLKEERDSLAQMLSMSTQRIALLASENEEIVKTLKKEMQSRKNLEGDLRQFGLAFARRQGLFMSLCNEFKLKTEKLRVSHSVPIPEHV